MSFYHFCEFLTDYALPGHFLLQQADKASHIIDQIHHPDLDGCAGLANRPQLLTALLGERAKHMLNPCTGISNKISLIVAIQQQKANDIIQPVTIVHDWDD